MKQLLGCILLVALVVTVVVSLKFHYSYTLSPNNSGLGGLRKEDDIELLFVGSSHTRQSYDVHEIEKITGLNTYVLAYDGLSPGLMLPIIEHLLSRNKKQLKLMVVEAYVYSSIQAPRLKDTRLFFDSPPQLKKRYLNLLRKFGEFGWRELYELVVLSNNSKILFYPIAEHFLSNRSYRGGYINKVTPTLTAEKFSKLKSPISRPEQYNLNDWQVESLVAIMEQVRRHKVPTVFVESPMPEPVEVDAYTRLNKNALSAIIAKHGYQYVDGAISFDTRMPRYFADDNHLSTFGREEFSKQIASTLKSLVNQ